MFCKSNVHRETEKDKELTHRFKGKKKSFWYPLDRRLGGPQRHPES
jgi:hypothetical protein